MGKKEILDSWKAISEYLNRGIRTCYRWNKELGLPVYHIDKDSSRSKVFAYKSEIDEWLIEKAQREKNKKRFILSKNFAIISLGISTVLLSIVLIFLLLSYSRMSANLSKGQSIAVLPFENLESAEPDEYFPEGITRDIINYLSNSNKIKVVSNYFNPGYNTSFKSTRQISKELDVDYLLKVKMKSSEEKVGLYIQLARTSDEEEIWGEKYQINFENISSVTEEISKKISALLDLNIEPSLSRQRRPDGTFIFNNYQSDKYILSLLLEENDDPWELYWQGKFYWGKGTEESNSQAISFFKKAIKVDKNFALAYIGLARCYANNVSFGWDFDIKWLIKAEDLINTAQSITSDLPEYYASLIEIYLIKEAGFSENTNEAVRMLINEGIKRYPYHTQLNSIIGSYYFLKFGEKGNEADFERALEYREKSFWPDSTRLNNFIFAELLMLNKDFYRAIEICNIIEKYDYSFLTRSRLGEIYYYMEDLEASEDIFLQFHNAPFRLKIDSMFYLAMISAQRGDKDRALRLINEINLIYPPEIIINDYLKIASVYFGLGIKEAGYNYLRDLFSRRMTKKMRYIFHKYIDLDKNFGRFRDEKEFQKIIHGLEVTNG